MPDSRKIDDLMGSGELDRSRSRSGDLWPAIIEFYAQCARCIVGLDGGGNSDGPRCVGR